jgi:hypothetical protein
MTTQPTSEERCPDCGRAKHEHEPIQDFPCGFSAKTLEMLEDAEHEDYFGE